MNEADEAARLTTALEDCERSLHRSQAEFEEFTSRIAHDLREPLRTVATYCQLLSEQKSPAAGEEEGEEAKLFLGYILDGVDRANSLLTSMVEYATGTVSRRPPLPVDMNTAFCDAAHAAAQQPLGKNKPAAAELDHDPLPVVAGDFDMLSKVLRHLLENAIKFSDRPDPRVVVSARRDNSYWLFSVRDNGPGIDPAHHQRIFGLFKRLHGRDYPGSGLGLAFCQKAIESLGGRIWIDSRSESQPEGSAFYFTLPAVED